MGALRPFILITAVADLSVTLATDAAGAFCESCPTVALCKRRPDVPGVDETRQTRSAQASTGGASAPLSHRRPRLSQGRSERGTDVAGGEEAFAGLFFSFLQTDVHVN